MLIAGMSDVTRILEQIDAGDPHAAEQLLPLVYDELRKLAAAKLSQEKPGQTLQPTALVHEAYLRLVDVERVQHWDSRGHFFAAAAEAMRRLLVERARKRSRRDVIRGTQVSLEDLSVVALFPDEQLLRLDEALERLEAHNASAASIVELRFFAGLTMKQTADVLNLPMRTAEHHWTYARTWLHRELEQLSARDAAEHV